MNAHAVRSGQPPLGIRSSELVYPHRNAVTLRLQIGGFILITALLGVDAYIGFNGASVTQAKLVALNESEAVNQTLIDEVLSSQRSIGIFEKNISESVDQNARSARQAELEGIKQAQRLIFARVSTDGPGGRQWLRLQDASVALTAAMDHALSHPADSASDEVRIEDAYKDFTSSIADLVRSSHDWRVSTRRQIDSATRRESVEDRLLLSGCLVLASILLWSAMRTHLAMREQSQELNLVSWQLLEKQESLARRLSRDLHDELGQSLTALKTNFARHSASACVDPSWMTDCTDLLRDSMRNAHEISQLLRPTVLDDFGLESALSWLCEKFEERNGIKVFYLSDFSGRLDEHTETHVFRIAQEALTNVARHAQASEVHVTLERQADVGSLKIRDNGVGLPPGKNIPHSCLGITGMRARARSLGGVMRFVSIPGQGTTVSVTFELLRQHEDEQQN